MLAKTIIRFVVVVLCVYGVLTLGWNGFGRAYSQCFRTALAVVFEGESGFRTVEIPIDQPAAATTRLVIVNRRLLSPDGSGPVRNVDIPSSTFWNATALFIALALATPRRWVLRVAFTAAGTLVIQLFIAICVWLGLWLQSRHLGLRLVSATWDATSDRLQDVMIDQGVLVVPCLLWLLGFWLFKARWPMAGVDS